MSQETNPNAVSINTLSIRHGLLIGGILAVFSIIFYVMDPVLVYTNFIALLFIIAVAILLLVLLGIDIRKKIGGFWSFGQAYVSLIIMCVFITLVTSIVSFVLFKFVNPGLPTQVNDALMEVTKQRLEKFGAQDAQIAEALKPFTNGEELAKLQPTFINEIRAFFIGLLVYAIIDLIIAACIKKKRPVVVDYTEPVDYVDPVNPSV
jgi:hypothetical protein